jgi:hypothetical protein
MKIEIAKEEDRLTVAALLVKNGYTVSIGKETVSPSKKATYYVYADKNTKYVDNTPPKSAKNVESIPQKQINNITTAENDEFESGMMKLNDLVNGRQIGF